MNMIMIMTAITAAVLTITPCHNHPLMKRSTSTAPSNNINGKTQPLISTVYKNSCSAMIMIMMIMTIMMITTVSMMMMLFIMIS